MCQANVQHHHPPSASVLCLSPPSLSPFKNSVPRYGRISDVARFNASGLSGATDTSDRRLFIRCDCMVYAAARAAPKQQSCSPAYRANRAERSPKRGDRSKYILKLLGVGKSSSRYRAPSPRSQNRQRAERKGGDGAAHLLQRKRPRAGRGEGWSSVVLFPWSRQKHDVDKARTASYYRIITSCSRPFAARPRRRPKSRREPGLGQYGGQELR